MKESDILNHRKMLQRFYDYKISTLDVAGFVLKNEIDFDIFLPSIGKNLQREFVWTHHQKQELIYSMLKGVSIGSVSILRNAMPFTFDEWKQFQKDKVELPHFFTYEVIDGKQRLMTIVDFLNDGFAVSIDGFDTLYSGLSNGLVRLIDGYNIVSHEISMPMMERMSDDEKIDWLEAVNFSGTPIDIDHINNLKSSAGC